MKNDKEKVVGLRASSRVLGRFGKIYRRANGQISIEKKKNGKNGFLYINMFSYIDMLSCCI
jgi:hypothetical protein